jgi:anaerobic selenocysteine-containing dehydrogenase
VQRLTARLDEWKSEGSQTRASDRLLLIGRRQTRSNNSWMHNSPRLMKGGHRCTLLVHPDDAGRRGITDGDRVTLRSRVGEVEVEARLSDEMMLGVVSLPHGWGHDRSGVRLSVAQQNPGVSANDLTDETLRDGLSGCANLSGVPVTVSCQKAARGHS